MAKTLSLAANRPRDFIARIGGDPLHFIEQVDKLLYQAKHNGWMRAEFADFRSEL